jgi:hypothetical protein
MQELVQRDRRAVIDGFTDSRRKWPQCAAVVLVVPDSLTRSGMCATRDCRRIAPDGAENRRLIRPVRAA